MLNNNNEQIFLSIETYFTLKRHTVFLYETKDNQGDIINLFPIRCFSVNDVGAEGLTDDSESRDL
jgi:hypothetical protein